jgi:hypothetical protein
MLHRRVILHRDPRKCGRHDRPTALGRGGERSGGDLSPMPYFLPTFSVLVVTWGTPSGDQEIATFTPANLPAERMTADVLALSFLKSSDLGSTARPLTFIALPLGIVRSASTNSVGTVDLRPRRTASMSFSSINSNSIMTTFRCSRNFRAVGISNI